VAAPGLASNRAPVAAQLLTVTDHPGLDLALVFLREGDRAGGSHTGSGLVIEMPRFHNALRNTQGMVHVRRDRRTEVLGVVRRQMSMRQPVAIENEVTSSYSSRLLPHVNSTWLCLLNLRQCEGEHAHSRLDLPLIDLAGLEGSSIMPDVVFDIERMQALVLRQIKPALE
jgi:hypothetical protein